MFGVEQNGHRPVVDGRDLHIRAEDAGLHVKAAAAAFGEHQLIERYGGLRPGSGGEAGAAGLAVGIQGELADDQQRRAGVGGIDVHFACAVLKYAQAADFIGDFSGLGLGVGRVHAEQDEKALADAPVNGSVDGDGGFRDAGYNSSHVAAPF